MRNKSQGYFPIRYLSLTLASLLDILWFLLDNALQMTLSLLTHQRKLALLYRIEAEALSFFIYQYHFRLNGVYDKKRQANASKEAVELCDNCCSLGWSFQTRSWHGVHDYKGIHNAKGLGSAVRLSLIASRQSSAFYRNVSGQDVHE